MPDLPPPQPPRSPPAAGPEGDMPALRPPPPKTSSTLVEDGAPTAASAGRVDSSVSRPPRVGDLSAPWRVMMIATWIGVFLAFAGVWKASVEIGLRTWWIGPRSDPSPVVVQVIPFALAIGVALLAAYNVPRLPWVGVAGALAIGVIAAFDISRSGGLALVEAAIALGALLVAAGSFTGRYGAPAPPSGNGNGDGDAG